MVDMCRTAQANTIIFTFSAIFRLAKCSVQIILFSIIENKCVGINLNIYGIHFLAYFFLLCPARKNREQNFCLDVESCFCPSHK